MRDDLVPDVSLGTHFFNELVEMDMLYLALFPDREENFVDHTRLASWPNRLAELIPEEAGMADVVSVVDIATLPGRPVLRIYADAMMSGQSAGWSGRRHARSSRRDFLRCEISASFGLGRRAAFSKHSKKALNFYRWDFS